MMASHEDIESWYTYHSPKPGQADRYTEIRTKVRELAKFIVAACPDSQEQEVALRRLREVMMWANAAIAINE